MHIPTLGKLSTDILIIGGLALTVTYGMIMGHGKLRTLALSSYVGLVLAAEFGAGAYSLVKGASFAASVTPSLVRIVLFLAPVILLELSRRHHEPGAHRGLIITTVLAVMTTALLASGVMHQFEPVTLKHIIDESSIAFTIYHFRLVWLAAVPGLLIVESFIRPRHDKHH